MRAKVLKLLAKEGELSAKEIAIKLSISLSETYRLLRDLIRMKILERRKRKYAIKEPLSDILRYIIGKYKLEAIIKKRNLRILVCLINPATIVQIKECSSLSEKTLKEALNELLMRGIIKKIDDKFEIIDDPILRMFAFIMKNIILGLEKYAFIVYFGNTFIIKAVEKGKKAKGTKTAFSIFMPVEYSECGDILTTLSVDGRSWLLPEITVFPSLVILIKNWDTSILINFMWDFFMTGAMPGMMIS